MKLVTAEQMRELDRRATAEFGVPSMVLMENAGLRAFDIAYDMLVESGGSRVLVVCGKGNNGGDGFVVARHFHEVGADVRVILAGSSEDVKGDALINLEIARKSGIAITEISELDDLPMKLAHADLVVDALLGTGVKGDVTGLAADVIDAINASEKPVIAIDLPSGLDADTGQIGGRCVIADVTVTFALPKIGLATYPGLDYAGEVFVAEIGIPNKAFETAGINTHSVDSDDVLVRLPERAPDAHKGTFGHAAIIAGSVGLTGAAALSSMSAVRIGAGLVTLGIPESLNDILEVKVTEVMTQPLPDKHSRSFSIIAHDKALELIDKCSTLAIGPGIGRNLETVEFVRQLLPLVEKPMVIDADALYAISEDTSIFKELKAPAVITPHPGEMSRLAGTPTADIQSNRLEFARTAAREYGVVVVLKGAATVIASPDGSAWVNTTGSPALASGGTGDVLTGSIAGLLAQGLSAVDAAICGVYIHGLAGEMVAEEVGDAGAAAGDLLPMLPRAIERLWSRDEPSRAAGSSTARFIAMGT